MNVYNEVDAVLYSEDFDFTELIKECISDDCPVKFNDFVSNFIGLQMCLTSSKKRVVVVYNRFSDSLVFNEIVKLIENSGSGFVAVCDNANDGFEMMKSGAHAIVIKSNVGTVYEKNSFIKGLLMKVSDADKISGMMAKRSFDKRIIVSSKKIIAIGSSMGGTEAVVEVLKRLPEEMPPILIVQHMSAVFTKMYADRLNGISPLTVWEAKDGDEVKPGLVFLAPGDHQMRLKRSAGGYYVECKKEEKVSGHAPSVDVMFDSVADVMGSNAIGVILTGMGNDGSKGLLKMHNNGAYTIGQDEKTSMVYGMPKVAYEIGAVDEQVGIFDVAGRIMDKI